MSNIIVYMISHASKNHHKTHIYSKYLLYTAYKKKKEKKISKTKWPFSSQKSTDIGLPFPNNPLPAFSNLSHRSPSLVLAVGTRCISGGLAIENFAGSVKGRMHPRFSVATRWATLKILRIRGRVFES